jgi:CubicO group peptidase (beta-lactamase class C family)
VTDFADPGHVVDDALTAQRPLWEPDTDQGYGATAWGAYIGQLHRHLTGQPLGRAFREHIAAPLGLDAWIGAPDEVIDRAATTVVLGPRDVLRHNLPAAFTRRDAEGRMARRFLNPRSDTRRAFQNPDMGPARLAAVNDRAFLRLDLPWMSALATADALSKAYAGLLGHLDGPALVSERALRPVLHRESWSSRDRVIQKAIGWSRGFVKDEPHLFTPNTAAFGHPGAGGALGWADPVLGLTIGYVPNRMDWHVRSPRAVRLCRAIVDAARQARARP